MEDLLFSHSVKPVTVGDQVFQLCIISDLDEALDYYVKNSPSDTDKIPYFTRLWESAETMARHIVSHRNDFVGKRILEFGCGLGLPSFCAARCGAARVVASDFHPDCRAFFMKNAALNGLTNIAFNQMDWRAPDLEEEFDVAIGSDLIYEKDFVPHLAQCVDKYVAKDGLFIYADPGRRALQAFVSQLEEIGFSYRLIADGSIWLFVFCRNPNNLPPEQP